MLSALLALPLASCGVPQLIGGMAESARREGSTEVLAEYTGLTGKTYAVVVSADRAIQSTEPELVPRVTTLINERLRDNAAPSAYIPSRALLTRLYETPQWPAMPPQDVAAMLDNVQRLIWVEIAEYRLHEPGNEHVWAGSAVATVSVYESDSSIPNDPAFDKSIVVTFPDSSGVLTIQVPEAAVNTELSRRMVDRVVWLFHDHKEPNEINY